MWSESTLQHPFLILVENFDCFLGFMLTEFGGLGFMQVLLDAYKGVLAQLNCVIPQSVSTESITPLGFCCKLSGHWSQVVDHKETIETL